MAPRAWCDGTKSAEWLRDGTMRRIKGNEDTQTTNQILHTFTSSLHGCYNELEALFRWGVSLRAGVANQIDRFKF